jgi:predicted phosphodiesterase
MAKKLPYFCENNEITLFHGSPHNVNEYFLENIIGEQVIIKTNSEIKEIIKNLKTKYICFGHSHLEKIVKIDDKILINTGSVG